MAAEVAALWDVRFDGKPRIVMHICRGHYEVGQRYFRCDDEGPDGNCPHSQTTPCTCSAPEACEPCAWDAVALAT
jgi:hypothetical protein